MKKNLFVIPVTEALEISLKASILDVSGPGSGYNHSGNAGNTMGEDDDYSYTF